MGRDIFAFSIADAGDDVITDLSLANRDTIQIDVDNPWTFNQSAITVSDDGTNTTLTFGTETILIEGLTGGSFALLQFDSVADVNAFSQGNAGYDVIQFV